MRCGVVVWGFRLSNWRGRKITVNGETGGDVEEWGTHRWGPLLNLAELYEKYVWSYYVMSFCFWIEVCGVCEILWLMWLEWFWPLIMVLGSWVTLVWAVGLDNIGIMVWCRRLIFCLSKMLGMAKIRKYLSGVVLGLANKCEMGTS